MNSFLGKVKRSSSTIARCLRTTISKARRVSRTRETGRITSIGSRRIRETRGPSKGIIRSQLIN